MNANTPNEFKVQGFFGENIMKTRQMQEAGAEHGLPFMISVRTEPNLRRSAAWFWTGWWPKSWRLALCKHFGHPKSCILRLMECEVVAKKIPPDTGGEVSFVFEGTGNQNLTRVEQWCKRCGLQVMP